MDENKLGLDTEVTVERDPELADVSELQKHVHQLPQPATFTEVHTHPVTQFTPKLYTHPPAEVVVAGGGCHVCGAGRNLFVFPVILGTDDNLPLELDSNGVPLEGRLALCVGCVGRASREAGWITNVEWEQLAQENEQLKEENEILRADKDELEAAYESWTQARGRVST